jgi:CheY-like chemotaxis protein
MRADLAVVARYVRNVNGQIRVTSDPGNGTTFIVELPFEHAPLSTASKQRKLRNLFSPSQGPPKSPPPKLSLFRKSSRPNLNDFQKRESTSLNEGVRLASENTQLLENGLSTRPMEYHHAPDLNRRAVEATSLHLGKNDGQSSTVRLNILIADEDPAKLKILDERLAQWGHTVDIASNGQDCYEQFALDPSKIDVIIMDMKVCTLIVYGAQNYLN